MIVDQFKRWLRLGLSGFWSTRHEFYMTLARSLQKKELLRDYVAGEYAIAMAPKTADRAKAAGLRYMREVIASGVTSISEVLQAVMPAQDRMALSILGESKDQAQALMHLSKAIEEQKEMSKVVRSALITPALLLPVGFIFAFVLTNTTIPAFVESAPAEVWTGFNGFFRSSAEWFNTYGIWIFAAFCAFTIWLLVWGLPNITADWRLKLESARGYKQLLLNLVMPFRPAFEIYRDIQGTKMLSDLAFMLQSGRIVGDAVETLAINAQPWMRKHLLLILNHLQQIPGNYVGAFSHGILSPHLAGHMQSLNRVDSEARFDKVLVEIGTRGMEEARAAVKKAAFKLNFGLMFGIMALILYFYGGQALIVRAIQEANTPAAVMKREAAKRQAAKYRTDPSTTPSTTPTK